jgi:histidine triad (HIT) family protein
MREEDCIFCNFKDKEVVLYDDSLCYAIISKNPINKYHVLVIPKEHYENFIELPDETASHIFLIAKKISKAVRESCDYDAISHLSDDDISKSGLNLAAHYKFHIIPRFKKDMHMIDRGPLRAEETDEARSWYAKEIKKHL